MPATHIYGGWCDSAHPPGRPAGSPCATVRLTFTDRLRPEALATLERLHHMGMRTAILTGDRLETAQALADQVGIDDVAASCLPDRKITILREARAEGDVIAMVGDGINDAPALAAADVGVALGGGTDLAREAGDVTLLGDRLDRLPWLIDLAHEAYRAIRRNLTWACGYNVVAITAAFFGLLHPLIAVLAMLGSSTFILSNSVRIARRT